jgi:hypothetical protein
MSVQPFKIDIPQATLDDLHDRLARTPVGSMPLKEPVGPMA